jgi:homoserine O-acetyltransferase
MEQRTEHEETTYAPNTRAVRRALHVIPTPTPAPAEAGEGTLQTMEIGALDLECGGHLDSVTLAYRTWGELNEAGDNAILVVHALTGDSQAGGEGGWWEPLIGSGRPLDTDHAFVVCSNVIGGCQGSTGPSSIDPLTGRPYAMRFPLITIGDMVNAQRRLVERLGISKLVVAGGSIGGFQALEWATRHADLVAASIPIAATESLSPQGIAVHSEIGRRAIMADANWRGGEYASEGVFPTEGLAIARMAAMTTYHSNESMAMRFGRSPATRPGIYPSFGGTFDVEGYLQYQGAKLVRRFDANSYLYLTRAMDLYDLGRNGGEAYWLRQIAAPMLLIGIRSDWLFPPNGVRALAERINATGGDAQYAELDSPHGHDAFLKEWEMLDEVIRPFIMQTPAGAPRT